MRSPPCTISSPAVVATGFAPGGAMGVGMCLAAFSWALAVTLSSTPAAAAPDTEFALAYVQGAVVVRFC